MSPLSRESILAKVRPIIAEHLDQTPEAVTETAGFMADLGADSLDCVEMIIAVEEALNVDIPDDAIDGLTSLGRVVDYLEGRV